MSALESRGFVGDYGDRAAPRLTSEDSYKRELFSFFFLFSGFSRPLPLSKPQHEKKKLKTQNSKLKTQIKGAMRGVNVVAMEELSEEAIAAARSRRMRER